MLIWLPCILVVAFAAYVRLAPSDPDRWHRMPAEVANSDLAGGAMRVLEPAEQSDLEQLDQIIRQEPMTHILAGSLEDGMVTYVSRSKVWGFPDYTTVRLKDGRLEIYGRLRFGHSDLGVNATRIEHWLRLLAK